MGFDEETFMGIVFVVFYEYDLVVLKIEGNPLVELKIFLIFFLSNLDWRCL